MIHEWKLGGEKKEDDVPPVDVDKTGFPGRGNRDDARARGEKGGAGRTRRRRRRSSERKGQRDGEGGGRALSTAVLFICL